MADVSGPTTNLPGSAHRAPQGAMCDNHPEVPAVARITGEVDSFGAEYHDMCQPCHEAYRKAKRERDTSGICDWCSNYEEDLRPKRDIDEGSMGRVYQVCKTCRQANDEYHTESSR